MNDLVSVIIPVYNCDFVVSRAIDSVLKQTHQNFEIIIVDDASTDKTMEVLSTFKDPRIKISRNKVNLKSGLTRNVALDKAKGDYIAFLDADDAWHKDKLEYDLKLLKENPEFDVVCSKYISAALYNKKELKNKHVRTREINIKNILFKTSITTSTVTMRNNVKERFPKYVIVAEDLYYWVILLVTEHRILKSYKITTYYNNVFNYRLSLKFALQHHNEIRTLDYAYGQKAINKADYLFFRFLYFLKYIRRPFKFAYLALKEKLLYKRIYKKGQK